MGGKLEDALSNGELGDAVANGELGAYCQIFCCICAVCIVYTPVMSVIKTAPLVTRTNAKKIMHNG